MSDLFTATDKETEMIATIAIRAADIYFKHGYKVNVIDIAMDLEACHCNGCPLRLADMEQADDFNLMHDITGINAHLNHDTGKLEGCFLPRFAGGKREGQGHE